MADKLLKTRIALKQNTYEYWTTGEGKDYVPLYGEVCLCEVSNPATATTAPTVLFKVGTAKKNADGTYVTGTAKKFSELNWVSALAADVYSWAKKTEVEFIQWILPTINDAVAATEELTSSVVNGVTTITHNKKLNKTFTGTAATGSVSEAGGSVTIKVPKLTVNEYGHVTAAEEVEYTVTLPEIMPANDGVLTLKAGGGLAGDTKTFSADQATNVEFEVIHGAKPVSGNAEVATAGSGRTYVTEVLVDDYGHIAGVKTATETDQTIPEETAITITDKTGTNNDEVMFVVTNLEEGGAFGHAIEATYTTVPTKKYVDSKVAAAVAGAVDYLGTVNNTQELNTAANKATYGDFVRVATSFTKQGSVGDVPINYHAGDLLIYGITEKGRSLTLKQGGMYFAVNEVLYEDHTMHGTYPDDPQKLYFAWTKEEYKGSQDPQKYVYTSTLEVQNNGLMAIYKGGYYTEQPVSSLADVQQDWDVIHGEEGDIIEVVAGNGLTGGGASGAVTLNVGEGNGITVSDNGISVKAHHGITVDGNGVSAKAGNHITVDATGINHGAKPTEGSTVDTIGINGANDRWYVKDLEVDDYGHVVRAVVGQETVTDTHHQAKLVLATDETSTEEMVTGENGTVHLNLVEDNKVRSSYRIVGMGGTSITSKRPTNGTAILEVNSEHTDTWRPITLCRQNDDGTEGPWTLASTASLDLQARTGLSWKVEGGAGLATATIGFDDTVTFILDCN